jgi:hypothetical protein
MSLPDLNIAKFNIPIKIQRAFDRGKIAYSYKEMYMVADKLASIEAQRRQLQKLGEYLDDSGFEAIKDDDKPSLMKTQTQILDYKNERIDYHMKNMIHMLELYVTSRGTK